MDYNIINVLPRLKSCEEKAVNEWYDDFDNLLKIGKIYDTETAYRLAYLVSEGTARQAIRESYHTMGTFPTLAQLKKSLLETKELTEIEIYDKLKSLAIKKEEDLTAFNKIYLELYSKVNKTFKGGITVKDYLRSIKGRKEACRAVLYDECTTIEDAIQSVGKVQKILEFENEITGNEEEERNDHITLSSFKKRYNWNSNMDCYPSQDKQNNKIKAFFKGQEINSNKVADAIPVLANSKLVCFRCKEEGHKYFRCPYSDEKLLELLTKRLKANKKDTTPTPETKEQKN